MVLRIEKEDNKFRVITQQFSTSWLPDTAYNRKVTVVYLRLLQDESLIGFIRIDADFFKKYR